MMDPKYAERCLRAIGIMTEKQLLKIKNTSVGVAGLGLGGSVFINLVRLGFERFNVADPDVYERSNINRQRAAKETTIGSRKDDCILQEARSINPDIKVTPFREGVKSENMSRFLDGIEWVIDAVDVFAMNEKIALHEEARKRKIPVITCVSVGFGASIVAFGKDSPSFMELSGLDRNAPYETNIDRFIKFIVPDMPIYMEEQVRKAVKRTSHIPFVVPGVEISAALTCTELCKHLLNLGDRVQAPYGIAFDPVTVTSTRFVADYRERDLIHTKKAA